MVLHIRQEQLDAFREPSSELVEHLTRPLAVRLPVHAAVLGTNAMRTTIERAVALGRRHDIHAASLLEELAALVLEFGEGFARSPDGVGAVAILEHPRLPPPLKLDILRAHLRARTRGRTLVPSSS